MKLIARWTKNQDSATEHPHSIAWEDGTPATLDDYGKHMLDTHTAHHDPSGSVEEHFNPSVIATVLYDSFAKDWVLKAPGVQTFALELHDPNIKDDQIVAVLYTFPTVYRANIVRHPAPLVSRDTQIN